MHIANTMAFTFKTAEENFISALPSKVADVFYSEYYDSTSDEITFLNKVFPFSLSSSAKEYISSRGIRVSPFGSQTHPHPVSKIFENHFLYNVLPRFIQQNTHLAVFSIKQSKAEYLYFRAKDFDVSVINRFLLAQDYGRYSNRSVISGGYSSFEIFVSNIVRKFRFKVPELLFFHDELMHWSLDDFTFFLARVKPTQLAFSFVYPIELLAGLKKSCNSIAYSFRVSGDDFFFFPDKSKQNPYQHSGSHNWPFFYNQINLLSDGRKISYSIDLVESHGAHHFFIVKRDCPVMQSKRFFTDFDCTPFDNLTLSSRKPNLNGVIRTKMLSKVVNYLVCLKKKDIESALGKLRQLTAGDLLEDELLIVHDLSEIMSKFSMQSSNDSLIGWLNPMNLRSNLKIDSKFLNFILGDSSTAVTDRLRELATQIKPFSYIIECKSLDIEFNCQKLNPLSGTKIELSLREFIQARKERILGSNTVHKRTELRLEIHDNDLPPTTHQVELTEEPEQKDPSGGAGILRRLPKEGAGLALIPTDYRFKLARYTNVDAMDKDAHSKESIPSTSGDSVQTGPLIVNAECPEDPSSSSCVSENHSEVVDVVLAPSFDEPSASSTSNLIEEKINEWSSTRRNGCFLTAVCSTIKVDPFSIVESVRKAVSSDPNLTETLSKFDLDQPLLMEHINSCCRLMGWRLWVYMVDDLLKINDLDSLRPIHIGGKEGHLFKINNMDFFQCIGLIESAYFDLFKRKAQVSTFSPNLNKAKKLLNSFRSMLIGLLIDKKKIDEGRILNKCTLRSLLNGENKIPCPRVKVVPFLGFAGSGKTSTLFKMINNSFSRVPFLWISPRARVLEEMVSKLETVHGKGKNAAIKKNFITFEKALLLPSLPKLIILDEAPLLPPGYLDLLMLKEGVDEGTSVALVGDTLQCQFHCNDNLLLRGNELDVHAIIKGRSEAGLCTDYLLKSHRFGPHPILKFVHTPGVEALTVLRKRVPSAECEAILVASDRDKRQAGGDLDSRVMTVGESQGCNFNHCALILTDDLNLSDIGTVITGITRARKVLEIVCDNAKYEFFSTYRRGINNCCMLATFNSDSIKALCEPMLHGLTVHKMTEAGADFELKLEGDPFLKSMMNMVEEPVLEEPQFESVEPTEVYPKTHLPLVESNPFESMCFERMNAREHREFFVNDDGWSMQFDDTIASKQLSTYLGPAHNPQCVFPRHKADDYITFCAAVRKRLFFSNPTTQLQKFAQVREKGRDILKVFLRKIPIDNSISTAEYEEAHNEFELKKISKSTAMITNHAIRSDTDWDERSIFLFMKSQLCKKKEKMFSDAKAGQTLACFAHSVLIKFSGVCRYIEKKLSKSLPPNYYVHQKKDFRQFEDWVKMNDFSGVCTESDYEAFDSSQDHVALAFEVALMEYLSFSQEVIDDYIFIKTHLYCKLGEFAIMRFTGEFCTFLFNTLVNMAFTFLKYDVKGNTSICFAGDDMCANQHLGLNRSEEHLLNLMTLKAKVDFTRTPTFCGWFLSPHGIVKCPILMCARLKHAIYKKELELVIDSYFLEFCFAYEKKEYLLDILNEVDLEYHYLLTRFFVKKAWMLKGTAREAIIKTKEQGALFFGEGFGSNIGDQSRPINFIRSFINAESHSQAFNRKRFAVESGVTPTSVSQLNGLSVRGIMGLRMMDELSTLRPNVTMEYPDAAQGFNGIISRIGGCCSRYAGIPEGIEGKVIGCLNNFKAGVSNVRFEGRIPETVKSISTYLIDKKVWGKEGLVEFGSILITNIIEENQRLSHKCQSLVSESSSNLLQGLSKSALLMELKRSTYTKMLEHLSPRALISLSVSRSTLLFQSILNQAWLILTAPSLILLRQITSGASRVTTVCCTSLRSCFQLQGYFRQLDQLGARCSSLMAVVPECAQLSKMVSLSICRKTLGLITCTARITWSQSQMRDYKSHLSYALSSMGCILRKVLMPFTLTLGLCTDYSITQTKIWFGRLLEKADSRSFKPAISYPISGLRSLSRSLNALAPTILRTLVISKSSTIARMLLVEIRGKLVECVGTMLNQFQTALGPVNTSLITIWISFLARTLYQECLVRRLKFQLSLSRSGWREMAARAILGNQIQRELRNYLWENIVDSTNVLHLTPAEPAQLTQAQQQRKDLILDHFLKNLFGNIAIEGASDKVSFINMDLDLPALPAAVAGTDAPYVITHNLRESVGAIKAWRDNHASSTIRALTLRACCRPFANQAMDFLIDNPEVRTNLYFTQPHHYGKAPEVAFDFSDGISTNRLSNNRDRQFVMSAMQSRTFNHESKKGVFEAQGAINVTFDG
uniref:Polyprotein n=1 Tax=Iranian poppy betaflexivirus TaxID=2933104 RepID=A0A9C7GWI1_9VIRU|nr:polyprotein [Iranian poppy betaflexivirus]CAI5383887.1 polyprotein [Iranian poppy betaflexivirus]